VSLLDWMRGRAAASDSDELEVVRRITAALEQMDPDRARFVAAFAYLLGRVASADRAVSDAETKAMERIVAAEGGLTPAQAVVVVQIAKTENLLFGGTEDFRVAQEFRQISTPDERRALLRCLFAVSASDESVVVAEDNEIRRVSMELRVPHAEFIAARQEVREHLAVLRKPDAPDRA
jgi:uncharacterized tellurite resistance protein B-like protein